MRTQVQFTDEQLKALREVSRSTGLSVAGLVRQGMDQYLAGRSWLGKGDRILREIGVAGSFSSGVSGVSSQHDRHLAEAFGK